jgi:predicted dienelactone hydrolase
MSAYDPFKRGPYPVGVKTYEFTDPKRERRLPVECWYPATDAFKGKDLDRETQDRFVLMPAFPKMRQAAVRDAEAADGVFPLVVFSHGFAGHRRQTTHFCTHLASHGYVVASVDHVGNTMPDIMQMVSDAQKGEGPDIMKYLVGAAGDRPLDASFTIDSILGGEMKTVADPDRIGITGHSFGGWTTLVTTRNDQRIKAALPLAPGGGRSQLYPESNALAAGLELDWEREVPVLYLAADFDSLLPLDGMKELFGRTPGPKDMVVLKNADHFHFCDGVEQTHDLFRNMGSMTSSIGIGGKDRPDPMKSSKPSSELCPGKHAYTFLQGMGLAHMDAHLKGEPGALELLKGDLQALLADRGIEVEVVGRAAV